MTLATTFRACSLLITGVSAGIGVLEINVPRHTVGNWRAKENYLVDYEYIAPGKNMTDARLNSCAAQDTPVNMMCNGHGRCMHWNENTALSKLTFCQCDTYWADPECRTERQSQVVAFLLSVFLGPLGVDHFYLGFWRTGAAKLCTLGGCGLWYMYDVVRIGSTPVLTASKFKVAGDLPHWAYLLAVVTLFGFIGFFLGVRSIHAHKIEKARTLFQIKAEAEMDQDREAIEFNYSDAKQLKYGSM